MTQTQLNEKLRNDMLTRIIAMLTDADDEVLTIASNEIAIPTVDADGNDKFITIKVTVPKGTRDGLAYDGYEIADEYKAHCQEMAERKRAQAEAKAKKVARDKANREKLAQSKADHKAKAE